MPAPSATTNGSRKTAGLGALDASGFHDPALGEPARQHPCDLRRRRSPMAPLRRSSGEDDDRCSWRATNADARHHADDRDRCERAGERPQRSTSPLGGRGCEGGRSRPYVMSEGRRYHPPEQPRRSSAGSSAPPATPSHRTPSGPHPADREHVRPRPVGPRPKKTPPAATAASAIASPATTSTSIGPCTAALRFSHLTARPTLRSCVIVISLAPCLEEHRPQQRSTSNTRSPPGLARSRKRGVGERSCFDRHPPGLSAAR